MISVDVHIGTVFTTVVCEGAVPRTVNKQPGLFLLPKHRDAVITECKVSNLTRNKTFLTTIMSKAEMKKLAKVNKASKRPGADRDSESLPSDPELFHLPLPLLTGSDRIEFRCTWFWPMDFTAGCYRTLIPTQFPAQHLGGRDFADIATMRVNINTGYEAPVRYAMHSHRLKLTDNLTGKVCLSSEDAPGRLNNAPMLLSYECPNEDAISASVNVQTATSADWDQRGSFCLSLAPPRESAAFPLSIVFLLDRSGSMYGDPLASAKKGIIEAVSLLRDQDSFNVIAYDHDQYQWSQGLQPATQENKRHACEYVDAITAGGMTDIMTPLMLATQELQGRPDRGVAAAPGIPAIFLLTDGAVENEREICRWAVDLKSRSQKGAPLPRIHTFGVGTFCNHYFLRQLSAVSRGLYDISLKPFQLAGQIRDLMNSVSTPLLTDIVLQIPGLTEVEIYPFPIPDLYAGRPLLVSGKFFGSWPAEITVVGYLSDGRQWQTQVKTFMQASVPLSKVFLKQRVDLLSAKAWMTDDPNLVAEVVEISVRDNIPCPHTTLVGFEADPEKVKARLPARLSRRRPALAPSGARRLQFRPSHPLSLTATAPPPHLLLPQTWEREKMIKGGKMSGATMAGIAVGGVAGVAAVGLGVFSFGDIGATIGGLLSSDAMGMLGDVGGSIGDALGGIADGAGDILAGGFELCGDQCGDVCGNIGDCCADCDFDCACFADMAEKCCS